MIAKLTCNHCNEIIMQQKTNNIDKVRPLADYLIFKHLNEKHTLICENCKQDIQRLRTNDFGDKIDWNIQWEQYLCEDCYNKIWDDLLNNACGICETHPCEKGRDCWVNPWPKIMYLCYVAPRKML